MIKIIQRLLGWMPGRRSLFFQGMGFKTVATVFMGAPYGFLFLLLADLAQSTLTGQKVAWYTLGTAACILIQVWASRAFSQRVWPLANDLVKAIRIRMGEHLRTLSMAFFSKARTGAINTLAVDEMQCIQMVLYQAFPDFIETLIFGILGPLVLLICNWKMGLPVMGAAGASLVFFGLYNRLSGRALDARSKALGRLNSWILDFIQGMEVSRIYGQSGAQMNRTRAAMADFRDTNIRCELVAGIPIALSKFFLDLGIMAVLITGLVLFSEGSLATPLFIFFLIFSLRVFEPFRLLVPSYGYCNMASPAVKKIHDLLATPALAEPEHPKVPEQYDIRFSNVSFSYGNIPVFNDFNLAIPRHRITAIVGPSGAGKTTLTSLTARFWDVDKGAVTIGGVDVRDMNTQTLHGMIAMVFQDVYLFNDTIRANIAIGAGPVTVGFEQIRNAARKAECHEFIKALPQGYDTRVGEGGAALSGGERQRISIARAILKDAPIIILDEATASVDPENQHTIQQAIERLVVSKTLIVIAHRLATIANAHQVIVLDKQGEVAQAGEPSSLLAREGPFKRMWESRTTGRWKISSR